jgi:hypothetical protein
LLLPVLAVALALPAKAAACCTLPPDNHPPQVSLKVDSATQPRGVAFVATATARDVDDDPLTFGWQVDGKTVAKATDSKLNFSFTTLGTHTILVGVSDGVATATDSVTVTVVDRAPVAAISVTPATPQTGQSIALASTSTDADGDALTCAWDLDGNGSFETPGCAAGRSYAKTGTYAVGLQVDDGHGGVVATTKSIVVANQLPAAVFTATPAASTAGDPVAFDAGQSTDPEGADIVRYEWDFDGDGTFDADTGATPAAVHAYAGAGTFTATLRITDADGGQATTTRTVSVAAAPVVAAPELPAAAPLGAPLSVPSPAPVPAPAPKPAGGGAIAATLRYSFTRNLTSATFTSLIARHVPAGATVRGTCKGGGCPAKPVAIVAKSSSVSLKGLTGRHLKVGATITVTITKTGMKGRTIRLTVRRGKDPKLS